jgi:hypothetical protein
MRTAVTEHPTAAWLSRQVTEAFPWDSAPRYLLRPRRIVWIRVSQPSQSNGHHGGNHGGTLTVAECLRRTCDRFYPSRMSRPPCDLQRTSFAPRPRMSITTIEPGRILRSTRIVRTRARSCATGSEGNCYCSSAAQAQDALIKMIWLERAKQRAIETPATGCPTNLPLFAGVDVGGGTAETVAYVCEFREGRIRIVGVGAWRGQDTRGQAVGFLNQFRPRLCVVNVDSIGVGHNFGLHLRDERFPVEMVNVALPCQSKPNLGENDLARRFVNQKACFYQALADAFERDLVDGLTDEETIGQLAGIRWELDSQGRIKIESKERARERGAPFAGPSRGPDAGAVQAAAEVRVHPGQCIGANAIRMGRSAKPR